MKRYLLQLPHKQDPLIIEIHREQPPLLFLQRLHSASRIRVTQAISQGSAIHVLTNFRFELEERHLLILEKSGEGWRCSGSILGIGSVEGEALPFYGKTRYDHMTEELESRGPVSIPQRSPQELDAAVEALLQRMTLEEKIGQMSQSGGLDTASIGGDIADMDGMSISQKLERGALGSIIHQGLHPELAYLLQKQAVERSRLGIPLIFCQDIIHGYQTVLPIPLACACSFDPQALQSGAAMAAAEASTAGLMYAFAPMLDIARDPRWGRIAESNGEDPYLDGQMAQAVVKGYQGDAENSFGNDSIAACLKHFVGYGAAEGGRDYNTAEISDTTLHNVYLPGFQAGIDAGASSVMSSFNILNGEPMAGNQTVLQGILREEMGFDGVLITDYAAIQEICRHGAAESPAQAAALAANATTDIEMATALYSAHLPRLVREGEVSQELIDNAVRRILRLKFRLGIMDDPYRYIRPALMQRRLFCEEHRKIALEMAKKSIVLLKNSGVLPLQKTSSIAVIGPMADTTDLLGTWQFTDYESETVTIAQGLRREGYQVYSTPGCGIHSAVPGGIDAAIEAAQKADVIVLAIGEDSSMSGEAASRQNISIPQVQLELAQTVARLAKPVIAVLVNGRPLELTELSQLSDAVVESWFGGSMAGDAIAQILSGAYNPTGHLAVSFPAHQGQIPVYYNHLSTGRPLTGENKNQKFISKYLDGPNEPLYPFGYGLSYTTFSCSAPQLSGSVLTPEQPITLSVTVENTGERAGSALVQLYLHDHQGSLARPVKELKGFAQIPLEPGEKKRLAFTIDEAMVRYYTKRGIWESEPGDFTAMAGFSSRDEDLKKVDFTLKKSKP